jgi:transcriptional regulator with XRE-family HTH domain
MCEKTKQLGQLIRDARKAKKLSVREVSEATGIHPGAITKFELGVTDMSISRIFKLCDILGFSLAEISPENLAMLASIEELKGLSGDAIVKLQYALLPLQKINEMLRSKN